MPPKVQQPYAIAYLRVSSELQENIKDQLPLIRERAATLGLTIPADGIYMDEAVSRDRFLTRPGLQSMLDRADDPSCEAVIVNWFNRLYTSDNQKEIFDRLRRSKTRLFDSEGTERNTGTHEAELVDFVDGWMSKGQVRFIRQSVRDTHRAKALTGRFVGKPPYGIDVVPVFSLPCRGKCGPGGGGDCAVPHGHVSSKNGTVWVVNAEKRLILAAIFEWLAEGKTISQVQKKCIALGYEPGLKVTKKGANKGRIYGGSPWAKVNLIKMAGNDFYKGVMIWGKRHTVHEGDRVYRVFTDPSTWVVREHVFGEMIPTETWERANQNIRLRANAKTDENRKNPEQLWDGLIFCGRCSWKMHSRPRPRTRTGQLYDYYCQSKDSQYSRCKITQSIPLHYLLNALRGGDGPPPSNVEVVLELDERPDTAGEITLIQEELGTIPKRLERIKSLAGRGFYDSDDEALDAKIEVETRRDELTKRLNELLAAPTGAVLMGTLPEAAASFFELVVDERIPIETRRAQLALLVERVIVNRPEVRFLLRKDFVKGMA